MSSCLLYYFILPLHQSWERNHTKPRRECLETTRPSSCLDAVSFFPLLTTRQPRVESVARSWNQNAKQHHRDLSQEKTSFPLTDCLSSHSSLHIETCLGKLLRILGIAFVEQLFASFYGPRCNSVFAVRFAFALLKQLRRPPL